MKKSFLVIAVVLAISCSSRTPPQTDVTESSSPKVSITAIPRQGFVPLRVSFHASLQGVEESNKDFYCLKEEWDFGDGSISTEQPHCETFREGSKITTAFFAEHVYETPGSYGAYFSLGEKKAVRSGKAQVTAIESMRGYSGQ
ncbi:MAG TPA: hypothetical protein VJ521_00570 [Acidobacteriota bacterium]|nr:hypothetical protein [Acidobacteriota bacterium]